MSTSILAEIERIESERRVAAIASRQELRSVQYMNAHTSEIRISFEKTEADLLHLVQKLLADDDVICVEILSWEEGDRRFAEKIIADRKTREDKEREERRVRNTPVVGKGATEHLYTDARAYAVVSFGKALAEDGRPKTIKVIHLDPQGLGIKIGPLKTYGDDRVIGHFFTDEEIEQALTLDTDFVETVRLRKDGRYYASHGCPMTFGSATHLTDYRR